MLGDWWDSHRVAAMTSTETSPHAAQLQVSRAPVTVWHPTGRVRLTTLQDLMGAALGNMGSAAGFAQHPIVDTALHPGVFQRPQSQQQHAQEGKYRLCLADHLPPETTASQEHVALPITPQQLSSFLELGSRLILDSSRTSTQRLRSQSPRSKHYVDKRYMPMLESCTFSRMGPMTPARDGWHGVS